MRFVIVEDEHVTRDGLAKLLGQMEGVDVCAVCRNAAEGYEQIVRLRPDGVITDIVMEGENGLAMIERCRRAGVQCAFVLLSGYNEFEYARQALKLQVFDYLSKPLDFRAMEDVVARLRVQLSEAHSDADRSVELLLSRVPQGGRIHSELLESRSLYVVAACFHDEVDGGSDPAFGRRCFEQLERRRLKRYGHHVEKRGFQCELITSDEDLEQFCDELRRSIAPGVGVRVGISQKFEDIERITLAIEEAIAAAQACAVENRQMQRADLLPYVVTEHPEPMFAREFACVRDDLYQTDAALILSVVFLAVDRMLLSLPPYVLFAYVRRCVKELCGNVMGERGDEKCEEACAAIDSAPSIPALKQRFKAVVREQLAWLTSQGGYKSEDSLGQAIGYVDINYARGIRLQDVARLFGIESTYFSKQFKKRTGRNFNDYITELRMKRARRLLELGNYTVAEVAELVGYQSQRHFSRLFKQHTGRYPSEVQREEKGQ